MIAYAAIDLRGGSVVQLVGGEPGSERVTLPDVRAVALRWLEAGFAALHVIDLDGALGVGDNAHAVREILDLSRSVHVQVGGGLRTTSDVDYWLAEGAATVVVGTRAIQDPDWLEEMARTWPGRIVVAADVRGTDVVLHGWTETSGITIDELLGRLRPLPLAAVLVTDVAREGRMTGADVRQFRRLATLSPHPLLASGGIAGPDDLAALAQAGAAGAVIGMALYTGALDPLATAREYRA